MNERLRIECAQGIAADALFVFEDQAEVRFKREIGSHKNPAKRIGIVIGPDGVVKEFVPKADSKKWPTEALAKI